MRRTSIRRRFAHLRVVVSAALLSLAFAAVSAASVLADGGGSGIPK